jgi:hypothetical protein
MIMCVFVYVYNYNYNYNIIYGLYMQLLMVCQRNEVIHQNTITTLKNKIL